MYGSGPCGSGFRQQASAFKLKYGTGTERNNRICLLCYYVLHKFSWRGGLYSGGDSGEGGEPVSGKDLWKGAMSAAGKAAMSGGQYPDMTDYSKAGLTEEGENKRVSKILSDFPELQFDNKGSFDFYSLWEELFNENFKLAESHEFKNDSANNSFTMSPSRWISTTEVRLL